MGAQGPRGEKGEKGEKGDPGVGGIDITGAAAGQIVQIAAVDDNGVPSAWAPVDMPTGGNGGSYAPADSFAPASNYSRPAMQEAPAYSAGSADDFAIIDDSTDLPF
jgi:hypothetical protein